MNCRLAILPLLALLAACNDEPRPEAQASADAAAEGEVLGGTISDAMLPLDTVKSQSPPLKVVPAEEGDDAGGAGDSEPGTAPSDAPAESEPEPAPAAQTEQPAEEG